MADSAIQAYEDAPEKVSAEGPGLLENTIAEYEADADFVAEALAIGVIEQATRIMELRSITRSELADKMGVSRARVAQIFNAPPKPDIAFDREYGYCPGNQAVRFAVFRTQLQI